MMQRTIETILYGDPSLSISKLAELTINLPIKVVRWLAYQHWDNLTRKRLLRLSNVYIENAVRINPNILIMDGWARMVVIGPRTAIAPGVTLVTEASPNNSLLQFSEDCPIKKESVIIGADCWLGANTTILPGVTIGDGCIVGAGAVVTKSLPSCCVAMGVPARPTRTLRSSRIPRWIADSREKIDDWLSGKTETPIDFSD